MSNDAERSFAVQGRVDDPAHLRVAVDTVPAMNTPLEESSRALQAVASHHAEQRSLQLAETQTVSRGMSA